jgi:hypothetical protein
MKKPAWSSACREAMRLGATTHVLPADEIVHFITASRES